MFRRFRILAILAIATAVGQSHLSRAQDAAPNAIKENLISIAPKDCALFVWVNNSRAPRFLSTKTEAFGFDAGNEPIKFRRTYSSNADVFGQFSRQDFDDGKGGTYQLHLGTSITAADTILYDTGTWTLPNQDGWLQIESVKAVSTCNPSEDFTQISYDEYSAELRSPDWLKSPSKIQSEMQNESQSEISTNVIAQDPIVVQNIDEATATLTMISPVEPLAYDEGVQSISTNDAEGFADPKQIEPAETLDLPLPHYTVQIGAFREQEKAVARFYQLQNELSYLDDLDYELQETTVENIGQMYRLRLTAMPDKSSANALCKRLKNDGVDCFVA